MNPDGFKLHPLDQLPWPLPAFGRDPNRITGLVVGAGLSKAANPGALTWRTLMEKLAGRLGVAIDGIDDPNTAAFKLSREERPQVPNAMPSRMQREIVDILKEVENTSVHPLLARGVGHIIERIHCDVIIDLNYDDVLERMLMHEGISYYRVVGSQVDVVPPLPFEGHVVYWKIHGSVERPSTIVLSPTDYERIYRSNGLELNLKRVAAQLKQVVTVGVGLTDDDLWRTVCFEGPEIVAIWLADRWTAPEAAAALAGWRKVLGGCRCTVLAGPLPNGQDSATSLCGRLTRFADQLDPVRVNRASVKQVIRNRWTGFDDAYQRALEVSTPEGVLDGIRKAVKEHARDYANLWHTLATWTDRGPGRRAWPSLDRKALVEPTERERLAKDLRAVLHQMQALYDDHVRPESGLLVACCAQALLSMVLDLVHGLELGSIELTAQPPAATEMRHGERLLVGANPFKFTGDRYNPLRFVHTERALAIPYPLSGTPRDAANPQDVAKVRLLREDEWEAMLVRLYFLRKPMVTLFGEDISLEWASPVFPWGFHVGGLTPFRRSCPGTVSTAWHLVEDKHADGLHQVCKGGSLQDTDMELFMLGYRGYARIGEADEFVEPVEVPHEG